MTATRRRSLAAATLATLAVVAGGVAVQTDPSPKTQPNATPTATPTPTATMNPTATPEPEPEKPNFVLVLTDDQRADDIDHMPFTRRLLGGNGVTFTDSLSPHPVCCPARAELITGQYGHNNGVTHNSGDTGGFEALLDADNTLPVWLQAQGYATAMSGKYLNGWKPRHGVPAGWTHFNATTKGLYSYTDTVFFNDGDRERRLGNVDDHIVDYTNKFIREFSAADQPFFIQANALAPHVWVDPHHGSYFAVPAKRHEGTLAHVKNPAKSSPAFRKDIVDGPVSPGPGLNAVQLQRKFRTRIESLQAVDEGVKSIVKTLRETGELDNTYIVFTSDNGNHLGEHGFWNKNTVFEEALRVPMIVRVPDATKPVASDVPVTLVDIPATVLDLAGATPGRVQDGVSFAPLLAGEDQAWRDTQLVQTGTDLPGSAEPGWDTRGVRTARWTYSESPLTGMVMLYDRREDPAQTVNVAARSRYAPVVADLAARLDALRACAGTGCQVDFGPDPEPLNDPPGRGRRAAAAREQRLPEFLQGDGRVGLVMTLRRYFGHHTTWSGRPPRPDATCDWSTQPTPPPTAPPAAREPSTASHSGNGPTPARHAGPCVLGTRTPRPSWSPGPVSSLLMLRA